MSKTEIFWDYVLLVLGGIFFILFLSSYQGERQMSFLITLLFTMFYVFWSIYHHKRRGLLRLKNVIEYILVGLVILAASQFIFLF